MSEQRSVLYKIRWEILLMGATLALTALVVLAIPNDFTTKMLEEQKQQREAEESDELAEMLEESTPAEMSEKDMTAANSSSVKP